MKKYIDNDHEPSILPDGREWKLVWNDEFDGYELDMEKWSFRKYIWGKRHPTFDDEGVALDGRSNAVFSIYEKDGIICSSQLQTGYNYLDEPHTEQALFGGGIVNDDPGLVWPIGKLQKHKFTHSYGYYECRCKLQKHTGWWSAFWLQSPVIGSSLDPSFSGVENDIMESFSPGRIISHNNHYDGYGVDHKQVNVGHGMDLDVDEYHTFGMLWEKDGYTFFVDGVQDGEKVTDPVSQIPQFILISTEVMGYRGSNHAADASAYKAVMEKDKFIVDYVRVFDEIS